MNKHARRLRALADDMMKSSKDWDTGTVEIRVMPKYTAECLEAGAEALERHDCSGIMGRIFGHKFEARFSEKMPEGEVRMKNFLSSDIEAFKGQVYEVDICVRCGLQRWNDDPE